MTNMNERDAATRRVMKSLARRAMTQKLPCVNDEGVAPIVIALPGELLLTVVARVDDMGGSANVVLAFPDRYRVCGFTRNMVEELESGDESVTAHGTSTIDMFFDVIASTATGALTLTIPSAGDQVEKPQVEDSEYAF
jgi:hypothetical protein